MPARSALPLILPLVLIACQSVSTPPRPAREPWAGVQEPGAAPVEAEKEGPKFDSFSVRLGGQAVASFATTFRLDSEVLGRGTDVRLERDLGFTESTQFGRIDAAWRFNRDHAVEFSYFAFSRRASKRIEKQIQWGDRVFEIDTEVYALFKNDVVKAAYRYTFAGGADWELGAAIGLHGTRLRTGVGIAGSRFEAGQELRVFAPLPVLGLRGTWELWDDFRFTGLVDAFYIKLEGIDTVDEVEGYLLDALVTAEYDLTRNVALGIGANYFQFDASVGNDRLRLGAEYEYFGGLLFGRLSF